MQHFILFGFAALGVVLPAAAEEKTEVVVEEVSEVQVPDSEKASHASTSLGRMKQILAKVLSHLAEARDDHDVVKLNCVNAKLTSVKGLLRASEMAHVALQEALVRKDTGVSEHEFDKISISIRKCEQLLADSEACVGQLAVYAGDTKVEVVIDASIVANPAQVTAPPPVVIERPAAASPFQ